jgi:putative endonuclease
VKPVAEGAPARRARPAPAPQPSVRALAARARAAQPWFLYLIQCRSGAIYTGIARDVAARYAAHVAGLGARYTRSNPPQRLLAKIEFPDQQSASRAEWKTKQMTADEKRALIRALRARPAPAKRGQRKSTKR